MKPLTVIDLLGNRVVRHDGRMLDGDKLVSVQVPFALMDGKPPASGPVSVTTLNVARRVLGDAYQAGDFASVDDGAARDRIVEKRLSIAPGTKSRAFLDAAYRTLAEDGSAQPAAPRLVLSDAQRLVAQQGVQDALRDHAERQAAAGPYAQYDAVTRACLEARDGARAAVTHRKSNAWKGGDQRAQETRDAGLTYEERMVRRSGGYANEAYKGRVAPGKSAA